MRRFGGLFAALVVALLLCPAVAARAQTTVTFADPNLEAAVRGTLNITTGPLTAEDLRALTFLYSGPVQITNLSGLEYATNLAILGLQDNAVRDVSPLAGLGNLLYLYCPCNATSAGAWRG